MDQYKQIILGTSTKLMQLRRFLIIAGILFITFAVTADLLGMSNPGDVGFVQVSAVLFGLLLIMIGYLGRRFVDVYRATAIITLNILVILFVMEAGLRFVDRARVWIARNTAAETAPTSEASLVDSRAALPYYRQQDWSAELWREYTAFNSPGTAFRYHPYVVWRGGHFEGETLNVDEDGIRQTPGAECGPDAYIVYMMGGSTLWGLGSPDSMTIPAYVQAGLAKTRNSSVCVVNFGQTAYVSTQNLITLLLQLQQQDNVPNLVIFYDGVNEVGASFANGRADQHANMKMIKDRFNQERDFGVQPTWSQLLLQSQLVQLVRNLIPTPQAVDTGPETNPRTPEEDDRLAAEIARTYLNNYHIVELLASDYGFEFDFFWQPVIFVTQKPLADEEKPMWEEGRGPLLADLYAKTYDLILKAVSSHNHLYYIADVFDKQPEPVFIDYNHLTPVGNRLVAEAMLQHIPASP
ncbi:MAG: SGNH/GDSL hydrolase family protein [Anaerolineae bacterium]|nr:SGNH/GDSL hydrolase family protein [Anaerolineae bacterium]